LYDDSGAHPGLQAGEQLAEAGARLEVVTPERFVTPEVGGLNHVAYARCRRSGAARSRMRSSPAAATA
jgi:N-methyl-L-proline demethylase